MVVRFDVSLHELVVGGEQEVRLRAGRMASSSRTTATREYGWRGLVTEVIGNWLLICIVPSTADGYQQRLSGEETYLIAYPSECAGTGRMGLAPA